MKARANLLLPLKSLGAAATHGRDTGVRVSLWWIIQG